MAAFVAILEEAGVPAGAVNLVLGRGSRLGPALLRAPASAVTFTGGNVAGKAVAAAAVDHGLKYQLELGGNNPVLVLADADLDLVTRELTAGAIGSTGQKCTATRRVFVVDELFDEVSERLQASFAGKVLGPGLDPATDVGPLVTAAARDDFEASVADAAARGADVRRFGTVPDEGFFGAPTILVEPDRTADYVRRETFGPMVSLMRVAGYEDGVRACNDTEFGLSASVFSAEHQERDPLRARRPGGHGPRQLPDDRRRAEHAVRRHEGVELVDAGDGPARTRLVHATQSRLCGGMTPCPSPKECPRRRSSPRYEGAGATHVVIVPDTNQKTVLDLLDEQPDLPVIRCAAEDDVFGVCTGLWFAGHRPIAVIQQLGIFAGANVLRGMVHDQRAPIAILAGMYGRDLELRAARRPGLGRAAVHAAARRAGDPVAPGRGTARRGRHRGRARGRLRRGARERGAPGSTHDMTEPTMHVAEATTVLREEAGDAIAVLTMSPMAFWGESRPLDFRLLGTMGAAASIGLGIALGTPDRTVWVIDGDGSLLMQLGVVAAVADAAPENYVHVVIDNGIYAISGAQPTPAPRDWAALLEGAGYRDSGRVRDARRSPRGDPS